MDRCAGALHGDGREGAWGSEQRRGELVNSGIQGGLARGPIVILKIKLEEKYTGNQCH